MRFKDGFRKNERHLKDPPEVSNVTVQNVDRNADVHASESAPVARKPNTMNAYTAMQLLSCVDKYGD